MPAMLQKEEIELLRRILESGRGDYSVTSIANIAGNTIGTLRNIIVALEDVASKVEDLKQNPSAYRLCLSLIKKQGKSDDLERWLNESGNTTEPSRLIDDLIGDLYLIKFIADPENLAYSNVDLATLTKSIRGTRSSSGIKIDFKALEAWDFWKELHSIADSHAADIRNRSDVIRELESRGATEIADKISRTNYGKLVAELNRQARSGEADIFFENDDMPDEWNPPLFLA